MSLEVLPELFPYSHAGPDVPPALNTLSCTVPLLTPIPTFRTLSYKPSPLTLSFFPERLSEKSVAYQIDLAPGRQRGPGVGVARRGRNVCARKHERSPVCRGQRGLAWVWCQRWSSEPGTVSSPPGDRESRFLPGSRSARNPLPPVAPARRRRGQGTARRQEGDEEGLRRRFLAVFLALPTPRLAGKCLLPSLPHPTPPKTHSYSRHFLSRIVREIDEAMFVQSAITAPKRFCSDQFFSPYNVSVY